ncbi:hypothetical protein H8R01_08500 [Vibrio metschnikovii]|uniref:hypothetical protein n=1 Tax=Vibrio metschnikovii TaxID=28172 RepID=UPI0016483CF5|nr:hypothetical protein [Vibrio metschnikovii]MBC3617471.1 hypothetical protein [Vibrio metschnikovii]MBC5813378.1 hypothetical protein [Vibrio metschnikovii]
MRRHQQGIATLLITAVLLSITLVITLGSYKNLFYQIKRAQNEVSARQSYWLAEGGVECLYAYIAQDPTRITGLSKQVPGEANNCKQQLQLDKLQLIPLENDVYRIHARQGYAQVNKQIYSYTTGTGAIQTNANLRLVGDFDIRPEAVGEADENGFYDCVAVRYKYQVIFHSEASSQQSTETESEKNKPKSENGLRVLDALAENNSELKCKAESKTSIPRGQGKDFNTQDSSEFKADFVQDTKFKPFESYFGLAYSTENYHKVKNQHHVITLNDAESKKCKDKLHNAFATYKDVWVVGNCFIHGSFSAPNGRSLVVENGLFATNGSHVYGGAFFHMIKNPEVLSNDWQQVPFYDAIKHLVTGNVVYIDSGAFRPDGGMVFDADGMDVVINGALNLQFQSNKESHQRSQTISLQQGSWNGY